MTNEDIANEMLCKNFTLNVDMIECIRRGSANILFVSTEGVLIEDKISKIYMISALNIDIAKKMIEYIPVNAEMIIAHQDFYCKLIEDTIKIKVSMECYHSVWMSKNLIQIPKCEVEVRQLGKEYLNMVVDNYSSLDMCEEGYLKERIETGNVMGAFVDNELSGFIGNHSEGSIGILEVLEEYRGKGIGTILQVEATNKALKALRIPYGEVKEGNEKSLALQRKLGFKVSKDKIYWLIR